MTLMALLLIIGADISFEESNDQLVENLILVRQRAAAELSVKREMTGYEMKICRIRHYHAVPLR